MHHRRSTAAAIQVWKTDGCFKLEDAAFLTGGKTGASCLNLLGRNCLTLIETVVGRKAINREQDFGEVGRNDSSAKDGRKTAGAVNEINMNFMVPLPFMQFMEAGHTAEPLITHNPQWTAKAMKYHTQPKLRLIR